MKKHLQIFILVLFVSLNILGMSTIDLDKSALSQQDKNAIIEQALNLDLPSTTTVISEEASKFGTEAIKKVHKGNYEEAIKITLSGLQKFPKDFNLQSDLAALLGDCSEITPAPLNNRMIEKSKALFDRLLKEADSQPKAAFYPFKNEYYFRFGMYREQYELGLKRVADYWGTPEWNSRGFNGYYNQGVGAAHYAKKLL